jgi:hypothetical protein
LHECGAIVMRGEQNVEDYIARFLGDPTKTPIEICPHCGALNTFPQFDKVLAYICAVAVRASISGPPDAAAH